jgi:hypothetical protein
MSGISNDMNPLSGNLATPGQQADEVQLGKRQVSQEQEDQETADATVVELSSSASSEAGSAGTVDATADVPEDIDAAGSLAAGLAGQITGDAEQAAGAHAEISAAMALKLTQP